VAGALSVSLIGQSVGSTRLLMLLVVGAVFWNYLSVVFQSIGDTITWERWEGTLEYTMMAPVRRSVQLLGSALYAVIYGLIHTAILLVVLALFFSLDLGRANIGAAALFMVVGSASFIGIGMLAAILPMMSVERGSQMVFVLQSCLLLISGVYAPLPSSIGPLRYISELSPATYVLRGVRSALIDGTGQTGSPWRSSSSWLASLSRSGSGASAVPSATQADGQAEKGWLIHYRTGPLNRRSRCGPRVVRRSRPTGPDRVAVEQRRP